MDLAQRNYGFPVLLAVLLAAGLANHQEEKIAFPGEKNGLDFYFQRC
jgi:hypothetical protein